jgi:hypothetical protein
MALSCQNHTAYIADRGGLRRIGDLGDLSLVRWERRRDDISSGLAQVASPGAECRSMLGMIEAGRCELVIMRGNYRAWEGPVTHITYEGDKVTIEAKDVMHYVNRTIMRNEYDNRYPNNGKVLDRIKRILNTELARKEALDPPVNVLPNIQYIYATAPAKDAGTAAHTLPYELTVFGHIDSYAARGGLDYTVLGRSIVFFDVHQKIGQTPLVTAADFIGDPVITQYGVELMTYVAMSDGKGHFGAAGGVDDYYGEWEGLFQAYDENATQANPSDIPSVAELTSQSVRTLAQTRRPPLVVRIPDGTRVNPRGVLRVEDLVPGIYIPLTAKLPGRTVSQIQKLDNMSVEESAKDGESIKVTMSPAPMESDFVETDIPLTE